ncbi:MAG: hypothetical protein AAF639_02805 [Chloroflexota bacterium]
MRSRREGCSLIFWGDDSRTVVSPLAQNNTMIKKNIKINGMMSKIDMTPYLKRVARDFDRMALNPPPELRTFTPKAHDDWVFVGYVPSPKTRLGWFVYHMIHGLLMRYPLRSVIAFSLWKAFS